MPVPSLYWADAVGIEPVQARYWHLPACLQGIHKIEKHTDVSLHPPKNSESDQ